MFRTDGRFGGRPDSFNNFLEGNQEQLGLGQVLDF
jgi:hypothetical protein